MLGQFAEMNNMVIKSTQFPHKRIHLGTWKLPDDHTVNQIDHILVSKRYCTSVIDSRNYRTEWRQ